MTFAIRPIQADDADLEALVTIFNTIEPEDTTSVDEIRWAEATYPGAARLLVETDDGRAVGAASVGRIYMYGADFDAYWAHISVLPDARRQGIGSALLAAASEHAARAGKVALHSPASDARPEGIEFLSHRGFVEYERSKSVRLELAGLAPPPIDLPAGISLTTLAERTDLGEGIHAVAVEAFADIPGGDEPAAVGDLAEFRARDVDRPSIPPEAFMIALDESTGRVVGYASLLMVPGQDGRRAWHDMTAVSRAWRGRGLAMAMKRATIGWAIEAGLETLDTGNDEDNLPMRAVNARLGYQPLPDVVVLRGPLVGAIMDR